VTICDDLGRVRRAEISSAGVKFFRIRPIYPNVTDQEHRREQRLRSKGEVTIFCAGMLDLPATIHDMGVSGLGLLAAQALPAGAQVRIESHGHMADGVVRHCRPQGDQFHIGVAIEPVP
jgi:PilZ domain